MHPWHRARLESRLPAGKGKGQQKENTATISRGTRAPVKPQFSQYARASALFLFFFPFLSSFLLFSLLFFFHRGLNSGTK